MFEATVSKLFRSTCFVIVFIHPCSSLHTVALLVLAESQQIFCSFGALEGNGRNAGRFMVTRFKIWRDRLGRPAIYFEP